MPKPSNLNSQPEFQRDDGVLNSDKNSMLTSTYLNSI